MSYYEIRIGNTFKNKNDNNYYELDKYKLSLMFSENVINEINKRLTAKEISILYVLSCCMDKKTNALIQNRIPLKWTEISSFLGENYNTFIKTISSLEKINLIKKLKFHNKDNYYYIINPFFAFKGKSISIDIYNLFKDTEWARLEDLTEYLPKRNDIYYNDWIHKVLDRDNYMCVCCRSTNNLQVHHIKSYAKHKELRTDIHNGITLCECCHSPMILNGFHQVYDTYNNTIEQLQEYINNKRKQLGLPMILIEDIINKV